MLDELLARFRGGDRAALSRLLTLAARGQLPGLAPRLGSAAKPSRVVAVSGSGGVGKSTLVGRLLEPIRGANLRVAVLACDPQSPLSGGALLGDRARIPARADDPGVFIRSVSASAGHGAVAEHLPLMVRLLERFGFDVVLIETVGAGQGETAVAALADVLVVLVQPEAGDDLQWEKAGLVEVADIVAVNKADLPGADQTEAQVLGSLSLSASRPVRVLRVSARTGEGVAELWRAIAELPLRRPAEDDAANELLEILHQAQTRRLDQLRSGASPALADLVRRWQRGELVDAEATSELGRLLAADRN